jgi:SAM-dependent methyltransferase
MNRNEPSALRKPPAALDADVLPLRKPVFSEHIREGDAHRARGDLHLAIECYLRAIELRPELMEGHSSLCAVLLQMSQFEAVATHYRQILAFKPDFVDAYNNLAYALIAAGDSDGALEALLAAFRLADLDYSKALFVLCLKHLPSLPASGPARTLLLRAMSEPWGRPSGLARHCAALVKANPGIAPCIEEAVNTWPAPVAVARSLPEAASDDVLRCLLENARVSDVALERYLTNVRRALLESAVTRGDHDCDPDLLTLYGVLACQCFINEYVFAVSDAERTAAAALRETLVADLRSGAGISALRLAAIAAYFPLHTIEGHEALLARPWPAALDTLLTQQIREPAAERRLRADIPALTPIDDCVSLLVRQQYEENPYPRWAKSASPTKATTINQRLRQLFPFSGFRDLAQGDGAATDVLVAGCGTGQQLIDLARRTAGVRILAIDLSLASLSYAKRKTNEAGLYGIEYGHADILRLGAVGRRFDMIDCSGVLHHLGDPLTGWRVLRSLLRPGGVMRIALYSELARRQVVAAHRYIAEHSYGRAADDIRRFRQDIMALPDDHPMRVLARTPDFFTMSDCRDLLFHVQEHRFTLPQIAAFLETAGLDFLGFEVEQPIYTRYDAQFPHDRARIGLTNWHAFEQAHPRTFGGMYQFWVQARD